MENLITIRAFTYKDMHLTTVCLRKQKIKEGIQNQSMIIKGNEIEVKVLTMFNG